MHMQISRVTIFKYCHVTIPKSSIFKKTKDDRMLARRDLKIVTRKDFKVITREYLNVHESYVSFVYR